MKTIWYKVLALVAAVVSGTLFVFQLLGRGRAKAEARNAINRAARAESNAHADELRREAETAGDPEKLSTKVEQNVDAAGGLTTRVGSYINNDG